MNEKERLLFLDGLKGLAAVWVVLFHFYVVVHPLIPDGWNPVVSWPFINVFFNGNFAVCLFLMVSGFLVSLSLERKKSLSFPDLRRMILKRYFRLALPIGILVLFVAVAYYLGIFSIHDYATSSGNEMIQKYFHGLNYKNFIKQAVYSPLGYEMVLIPCWMLQYVFIGSFLIVILKIALLEIQAGKRLIVYALALILLHYISLYYCCVLLGLILSDVWCNHQDWLKKLRWLAIPLFVVSFTLPSFAPSVIESNTLLNSIASCCMLSAVLVSDISKRTLSLKGMRFMGKLSLGIYLIHWPVICSLSCSLLLAGFTSPAGIVANLCITLSATIPLAFLYSRFIEPICGKMTDRFVDYLVKPSGTPSE